MDNEIKLLEMIVKMQNDEKDAVEIAREHLRKAGKQNGALDVSRNRTYSSKRGEDVKIIQDFLIANGSGENVRVVYIHDFEYLGEGSYAEIVPEPRVILQGKRR